MKSFKDYLAESKKYYSFKVKIAGDLPENFKESLKTRLERYELTTLEQTGKTPIQKLPRDFPEMENSEVTMFEVITEYPVNAPQIETELREIGIEQTRFRVRTPTQEADIELSNEDSENLSSDALLTDPEYKESAGTTGTDYFGDDYNTGFLKDLQAATDERKKELDQKEDANIYKDKNESISAKSPVGST